MPIRLWRAVAGPANWFPVRSETTVARQWGVPDWRCDGTRPACSVPRLFREKVRPAHPSNTPPAKNFAQYGPFIGSSAKKFALQA